MHRAAWRWRLTGRWPAAPRDTCCARAGPAARMRAWSDDVTDMVRRRQAICHCDAENFERRDTGNIRRWRWWFNLTPSTCFGSASDCLSVPTSRCLNRLFTYVAILQYHSTDRICNDHFDHYTLTAESNIEKISKIGQRLAKLCARVRCHVLLTYRIHLSSGDNIN